MKTIKNPLLFLLLFFVLNVNAQNRNLLRLGTSYLGAIYRTNVSFGENPIAVDIPIGLTAEYAFQKQVKKNWRLSGGLAYQRLYYQYNYSAMERMAMTIAPEQVSIKSAFISHGINVPFYLHYFVGRNRNIILGSGLTQCFSLLNRYVTDWQEMNGTKTRTDFYSYNFDIQVLLQIDAGYRFKLKKEREIQCLLSAKSQALPFGSLWFSIPYQLQMTVGYSFLR